MVFALGKPNLVPPDPRFAEWIDILAEISEADKRRLARYLAANDIAPPTNWEPVIVGEN